MLFKRAHHTADVIDKDPEAPVEPDTDNIDTDDYMEREVKRAEELREKVHYPIDFVCLSNYTFLW